MQLCCLWGCVVAVQLAAEAPEALKPGDVGVLAEFLASKLTDWCAAAVGTQRQCATPAVEAAAAARACRMQWPDLCTACCGAPAATCLFWFKPPRHLPPPCLPRTHRRCVGAAVPGCLSLLQRRQQPSLAPLPEADAVKLVSRLVKVHVQGLDYKGRLACYELLLELMQVGLCRTAGGCALLPVGWVITPTGAAQHTGLYLRQVWGG